MVTERCVDLHWLCLVVLSFCRFCRFCRFAVLWRAGGSMDGCAGNCGITLTAASRVYLMEPCVDPAVEAQAAGRIHRLGQDKHVLCKRLCYRGA
jgi:hypothetical protein